MDQASRKFDTLFGACGIAVGFSYELIKRFTANSNAYVLTRFKGNKLYGSVWKNIAVPEMYWALGIILKMSLVSIRLGGLKTYFNPPTKIHISCGSTFDLQGIDSQWTERLS